MKIASFAVAISVFVLSTVLYAEDDPLGTPEMKKFAKGAVDSDGNISTKEITIRRSNVFRWQSAMTRLLLPAITGWPMFTVFKESSMMQSSITARR